MTTAKFGVNGSMFESFVGHVVAKYQGLDGSPDVHKDSWLTGMQESRARAPYPAVRFRRESGRLVPARDTGKRDYTVRSGTGESYSAWYSCRFDDEANVEIRMAADGWRQLECLHSAILSAMVDAFNPTIFAPGDYRHVTEEDGDPLSIAKAGHQVLIQTATWRIPMPHRWGVYVTPTGVQTDTRVYDVNEDGTAGPTITQP